jgi:CheY-like chemotaxis protein
VFLNLLINAAQAIPEGAEASNEIRVSTATDAAGRAVVAVRDTGKGMTRDVRERIFEPFFTTKPTDEGTGLGLAISHQIVAALGGEIVVVSEPGQGSELSVVLPAARPAPITGPIPVVPEPSTRRGRVLIVDDEPVIVRTLSRVLKAEHDITVADDSRDALARIAAGERFDVILCDLMMPEMSGMALHAELMRLDPEVAQRMVFLTGGASTPSAREFVARVPNVILEKPFSAADLNALLRQRVG